MVCFTLSAGATTAIASCCNSLRLTYCLNLPIWTYCFSVWTYEYCSEYADYFCYIAAFVVRTGCVWFFSASLMVLLSNLTISCLLSMRLAVSVCCKI